MALRKHGLRLLFFSLPSVPGNDHPYRRQYLNGWFALDGPSRAGEFVFFQNQCHARSRRPFRPFSRQAGLVPTRARRPTFLLRVKKTRRKRPVRCATRIFLVLSELRGEQRLS